MDSGKPSEDSPALPSDVIESSPSDDLAKMNLSGANNKTSVAATPEDISSNLDQLKMMQDAVTDREVAKNKAELCTQITTQLDHLPNEMLTLILSNINLQDLLFLRAVNSRWQAVIESLCQLKKSLFLCQYIDNTWGIESLWLNPKGFTVITYRMLNNESTIFLCRLFPRLQSLAIQANRATFLDDPEALFTLLNQSTLKTLALDIDIPISHSAELCDLINSMTSLRQLALRQLIHLTMSQLAPTLGRLQRFAIESFKGHPAALHHLGNSCTHLGHKGYRLTDSQLRHQLLISPSLFSALTHLRLDSEFDGTTLALLCENATNLQYLDIVFYSFFDLSPDVFRALSRLVHLIELKLDWIEITLATLARQGHLQPLYSVRRLSLTVIEITNLISEDEGSFRIIPAVFPNLEKLVCHFKPAAFFLTAAFPHLSSLTHLVELELANFSMNLTIGEVSLQPIPSVRVVRLSWIYFRMVADGASFFRIISAVFPKVEKLACNFRQRYFLHYPITTTAFHLSCLTHLVELQLELCTIDLTDTGEVPIQPVPSVRVLRLLCDTRVGTVNPGLSFCRTFSATFPGLRELYVWGLDIKSHLSLFANLRKHQI